jgi:hypothetical protein
MLRSKDVRTFLVFAIVYLAMIVMLFLEDPTERHSANQLSDLDSISAAPAVVKTSRIAPPVQSTAFRTTDQPLLRP